MILHELVERDPENLHSASCKKWALKRNGLFASLKIEPAFSSLAIAVISLGGCQSPGETQFGCFFRVDSKSLSLSNSILVDKWPSESSTDLNHLFKKNRVLIFWVDI
jgi:hypothetical protein